MNYKQLMCIYLCIFSLASIPAYSKEFDKEFIKKHLFATTYTIDSGASAIILYENSFIQLEYDNGILRQKHFIHRLIKILKSEALDEANIPLWYPEKNFSHINQIRGTTYNLVDGKLSTTTSTKADVLKKDVSKYINSINFSLADVMVGSVIEYSYEVNSTGLEVMYSWVIQGKHPKLESIFSINYPLTIEFTAISHVGAKDKRYKTEEEAAAGTDSFAYVRREYEYSQRSFWIRRNVGAIKDEVYVQNKYNIAERIEMQLTGFLNGNRIVHFNNSWEKINETFWKDRKYGNMLNGDNSFFDKILDSMAIPAMGAKEKVAAIYKYVREHYHCNNSRGPVSNTNMAKLNAATEVNKSEMNALLTAMLIRSKLPASIILLGTTGGISPTEAFPVIDRINYIVCGVTADSEYILLDASDKNNAFGILPTYCYNGFSWVLGEKGHGVQLTPDLLINKTIYNFRIYDFNDSTAKLDITKRMGLVTSAGSRRSWAKDKEEMVKDLDNLKELLPSNITILEQHFENQDIPDTNLVAKYSCKISFNKSEDLFLNTNLIKIYETNPFKATDRTAPIEFNCKNEYLLYTNITLPEDRVPDSISQPTAINYNNGDMYYKKFMGYFPEMHIFTINTSFSINNTYYDAGEYAAIRDFFKKMIDNTNEMVAFKKTVK